LLAIARLAPLKRKLGSDFWRLEQIVRPWWPRVEIPGNLKEIIAAVETFLENEELECEEIVPPGDTVGPRAGTGIFVTEPARDPYSQCKRLVWLKTGKCEIWKCQQAADRRTFEWFPAQPAGYPLFKGKLVGFGKSKPWACDDVQDFHAAPFNRFAPYDGIVPRRDDAGPGASRSDKVIRRWVRCSLIEGVTSQPIPRPLCGCIVNNHTRAALAPTVMVEIAPHCFVTEHGMTLLRLSPPKNGARYKRPATTVALRPSRSQS